jgi:hypothetical protein
MCQWKASVFGSGLKGPAQPEFEARQPRDRAGCSHVSWEALFGRCGHVTGVERLYAAAEPGVPDVAIRRAAVEALGKIGAAHEETAKQVVPILLTAAETSRARGWCRGH